MKNYKLKLHTVAIRTLLLLVLLQSSFTNSAAFAVGANVTVTATSGTPSATYSTLMLAFTAINTGTHTGVIQIAISGNTTETSSAVLNGTGSGSASYTSVLIYPTVTNVIIGGNLSPSTLPIIDLNGATNVTIDGRVNHTGSSTDLVIRNAYNSGNSTIRFINGASSNTVKYCTLKGAGASAGSGIIFFSTSSTSGNSNNIIDHNSIQFNGYGAIPQNCIFALGSSGYENSGNQITNNNIYDFSNPAFDAQGIFISSYNTTYTITGNSLYQKTSFVPTGYTAADVAYTAIKINIANGNGNNFTISNNYIGGSAAQCGGTAWTKSNSKNNVFKAISIATASGTASSIQGNTISNFSWTNSSNAYWYGIIVEDGTTDVNIGTTTANTIGATTGTGSITLTNGATDGKFFGINFVKGTCSGNRIGSITTASVAATDATLLFGIYKSGAASATISNNIIGRTDSVSINANSAASSNTQEVYGIYLNGSSTSATLYVTGNTIANLNNATTNASSAFAGIYCSDLSTSSTVSGNFISRLSASGSGTTATVYGIKIGAGATTYSNNIISLGGNTLSKIYGFYESGAASNNNTLYFNTVDIEGTPASGSNPSYALYSNASTNTRIFKNNIFANNRSTSGGSNLHYAAYLNYSTSTGLTMDYNDYYVSGTGGVIGYYNGANVVTNKIVAGQDVYSIACNPAFATAGGATAVSYIPNIFTTGVSGTGVTTDYAAVSRVTPHLGAYEATSASQTISGTVNVQGNSVTIASGDITPSTADSTDFGTVLANSSSRKTYTIQNSSSTTSLTVSGITISGINTALFTLGGITFPKVIAASGSTTFTVTFAPLDGGAKTATVTLTNDDCTKGTYAFDITGASCLTPSTPIASATTQPTASVPTGTITVSSSLIGLYFSIDGIDYTNTTGIFSSLAPGTYYVTAKNSDNCISDQSTKITINKPPVTVLSTAGTTAPTYYNTLKLAIAAINAGTHQGVINVAINTSTTETAIVLNASSSPSSYTSITIYPTSDSLSVSGSVAGVLIDLSGTTNTTIDGRVNKTGSAKSLIIQNTNASGNATLRFINGASSNTVKYCTIKGTSSVTAGIIVFSTSTSTGNSNNLIDNNNITNASNSTRPINAIYALGTTLKENTNNQITNNNIYDFLNPAANSQAIKISNYNSEFSITGNSFYETTSFAPSDATPKNVILVNIVNGNGNNFTISNNYIGGSAPQCGGGAWTKTNANDNLFKAISITTATGTASNIQGNTISNFNWSNSLNSFWYGMIAADGTDVNIGTTTANTIGAATGTGSLILTNGSSDGRFVGINFSKGNCSNNIIGAITTASTNATDATSIFGINKVATGDATISNNTIGSATSNSINGSSSSSGNAQFVYGISLNPSDNLTTTVSGNTIKNLKNASTDTSNGSVIGIYAFEVGTYSLTNNDISYLTCANKNSNTSAPSITFSVMGIFNSTTSTLTAVTGNQISNLANTYTSFSGAIAGIVLNSPNTSTTTVSNNFIHDCSVSASSTSATIYGLRVNSGTSIFSNNIISLGGNTKTTIYGIYEKGAASNNNTLYSNTVDIEGTPASGSNLSYAFYSNASTNTRIFKNNIFANNRSTSGGSNLHYAAYLNYSTSSGLTMDYNDYYVSGTGGVIGYYNGSNVVTKTIVAGQDAHSIACNPAFATAGGTTAISYIPNIYTTGASATGVTADYAAASRVTPHIGAYETTSALPSGTIAVKGKNISIANQDITPSTTDNTDFGSVGVDGSFTITYKIHNTSGSNSATLSNIVLSGSDSTLFELGGITFDKVIAASDSTSFTVKFSPLVAGLKTATVTLVNADCVKGDYSFNIQGTGCTPPASPTATATQSFCSVDSATVADLATLTGSDIKWYSLETGGTLYLTTDALVDGTDYWASQTVTDCESSARVKVTATVTICAPTIQSSKIVFSAVQTTQFTATWTKGNGSARAVFIKQANTGTTTPVDLTTYVANTTFMDGDQIGSLGWYCIYNGTDSTVTVTGLTVLNDYIVEVFEYNDAAGSEVYNTTTATDNPNTVNLNCSPAIEVQNTLDSGVGSLRQAILDACVDGIITFNSSLSGQTITLSSAELLIDKGLTIDGSALSTPITVSGNSAYRVFNVNAPSGGVFLNGLVVTDGSTTGDGAGLYVADADTIQLTNVTVSNSTASSGGGLYKATSGIAILDGVTFTGNSALWGAAMYLQEGTSTITGSTISDNTAVGTGAAAGGIYQRNGDLSITTTTISNNSAVAFGGAIYLENPLGLTGPVVSSTVSLNLSGTTISGNTASDGYGGGIYVNNASVNMENNTKVINNTAHSATQFGSGGGIYLFHGTLTSTSSAIRDNSADVSGGGIYVHDTDAFYTSTSDSISTNTSTSYGAGVAVYNGNLDLETSIVKGNISKHKGGGVYLWAPASTVIINGSTFTDNETKDGTPNDVNYGGALFIDNAQVNITGTAFSGNKATRTIDSNAPKGGAIYLYQGTLDISGGSFDSNLTNTVNGKGGAIFNDLGTLTSHSGTSFTSNSAGRSGGAIFANQAGASTTSNNALFTSNSAVRLGGAIYLNAGALNADSCVFSLNTTPKTGPEAGGAINLNGGTSTIRNSTFHDNSSYNGGGVYFKTGTATLVNSLLYDNTASFNGGAIYTDGTTLANLTVTNSTLAGNSATTSGGGLFNLASTAITINNSILWSNSSAGTGNQLSNSAGTAIVITNSDYANGAGDVAGTAPSAFFSLTEDPLFVDAASKDFKLKSDSPALDAGDDTKCLETNDIRGDGYPRNLNKDDGTTGTIDMGAYEYYFNVDPASDCVNPTLGGTIAAAQTICSGTAPAAFTSTTAPSGHTGTLEYKWQVSTTDSISSFSDIASADSITFASDTLTVTTWFKRLSRVDCKSDWTGAKESNVVKITVNPLPTITVDAAATEACITSQTTLLYYSAITGDPITYSIVWNASPSNSFAAVTDAPLTLDSISLVIPANTLADTYTGTITVKNLNGCVSAGHDFTLTISAICPPSLQVSDLVLSGISDTQFTATWTNGNSDYVVVFAKEDSTQSVPLVGFVPGVTANYEYPVDHTTYTANTVYPLGSQIGTSGWFCIYNGIGQSVTVTGITSGKNYIVEGFGYNGTPTNEKYDLSEGTNMNNGGTNDCINPTSGGTIGTAQSICSGTAPAAFTSSVAATGQTGTLEYKWCYSTTDSISGFSNIASSDSATYSPGTLSATTWYKRLARVACKLDWIDAAASNVVKVTVSICAPSIQASQVKFSAIQATQVKVGWTKGNGSKRAVFIKQANTGTTTPVNGTTYTANTVYTSGTQIGSSGWYTIYNGTDTTVTVTGLTATTNYIVEVFEYNGSAGSEGYNTSTATNNPRSTTTIASCTNPTSGGTIATAQTICSGTAPSALTSSAAATGQTGTLEYKWQSSTNSSSSGFSDIASSNSSSYSPGTLNVSKWYKRLARVSCKANWSGSLESNVIKITVNALPTQFNVTGGGSFCSSGSGVSIGLSNSQSGISYQLKAGSNNSGAPVLGTGHAISFGLKTTTATYTVVATNTTTYCTATMSGSAVVTANIPPTLFSVTGGGSFCFAGTGVAVGLRGSQIGVTYQLKAGANNSGSPVAGTGSAINFGLQATAATYTVVATNTTSSCTATMSGSAVVVVNALPTSYTLTGGGVYCTGSPQSTGVAVGLSGSQSGVNYQLLIGGVNSGATVAGTGMAISFGLKTTAGTFTVVATNATTGCSVIMTGSAIVTVSVYPAAPAPIVGAKTLSAQTQLKLTDTTLGGVWSSLTPTIASVNIVGVVTGLSAGTATIAYTVTNAGGCSTSVTTSFTINGLPLRYSVTGGGSYCSGGNGVSVRLSLSELGMSYQLLFNGVNSEAPILGTGLELKFGFKTEAGVYTVIATNVATGVSVAQVGSATVVINPVPVAPAAFTGPTMVCVGSFVTLKETTVGGLWSSSAPTIASVNTRGEVTGVSAGSATIKYQVTNPTGCSNSASTVVTVNPLAVQPGAFLVSSAVVKKGAVGVVFTVPLVADISYNWSYTGLGATIVGNTNSVNIDFSPTATSGNLSVTTTSGCGTSAAQTIAVIVNTTGLKFGTLTAPVSSVNPGDKILTDALKVYPNPASGPVFFEFTLGETADAKLDIYTLNGKYIARIFDGSVEAGVTQTVLFEQYLPSGLYPCVLSWKGKIITIKFVVRL